MRFQTGLLFGVLTLALTSCFSREEKSPPLPPQKNHETVGPAVKVASTPINKDKSLEVLSRLFEQADAIHREAWWVLANERRPVGKSPFGKVQRALLASQNVKLTNKSMFRCDRYWMKRDVLNASGFPQKIEVFERCSEKIAPKLFAQVLFVSEREVQATFIPENLEEILGLGAAVVNKAIQCSIKGNERAQLTQMNCKDWSQERSKEHMIRLDVYEYQKEGQNLIKLRGKVYENLTDTRKIVADIPLAGKIEVLETELYPPPEATPTPTPTPTPLPATPTQLGTPPQVPGAPALTPLTPLSPLPPPREPMIDPDVLMQRQSTEGTLGTGVEAPEQAPEQAPAPAEQPPHAEEGEAHYGR